MPLVFFNTYTRRVEPFEPTLEPGVVRMYNCGPTVYGRQHVGNFRAFLFADTLRRWLEVRGYEVRQVMNITDVGHLVDDAEEGEDKVQAQARREGKDPWAISARYAELFLKDMRDLGCRPALANPRATEYVPQMLAIIDALVERGFAYRAGPGGSDVYFDVSRFPEYGRLSGNRVDELVAGARVEVREEKRHPADFALWKSDPAHLMKWASHYGPDGFPGWHIECSAMAHALLGERLDIHTGGEDNVFPHHECEIAQSEAFTGQSFARFWMHTRFLTVDGGKMSKSLGNVYTLDDVRARGNSMRELRYALIRGHYRRPLDFTFGVLAECRAALSGLDEMLARLRHAVGAGETAGGEHVEAQSAAFDAAMDDDLGTPEALAALFGLRERVVQGDVRGAAAEAALAFLERADRALAILGLDRDLPEGSPAAAGAGDAESARIEALVAARDAARKARDFAEADRLRAELDALGVVLQDVPGDATVWRRG